MFILIIRYAIALGAMPGGFASFFPWLHAGALARWWADAAAMVFVATVVAGKMLIPVVTAWPPSLCAGSAFVFMAGLASWPRGFGRSFDEWIQRGRLDDVGHLFSLFCALAAMTITTLIFLTPPVALS